MRRFANLTILALAGTLAFAQTKPQVKISKAEGEAVQALQRAQGGGDLDAIIKASDDLLTKFADTTLKAYVLSVEANAYEQKNDHDKAIVYAEQAIAADATTYDAHLLLANIYANTTRPTDLDKEEKLKKAEKYANDGIKLAGEAPKPNPAITDDQWTQEKKSEQALGYQALGSIAVVRKKYDDAIVNFQKGVDLVPDPVIMLRAGRALLDARRYDDAVVWFDKAAAAPLANAQIKEIAANDKKRALAAKK